MTDSIASDGESTLNGQSGDETAKLDDRELDELEQELSTYVSFPPTVEKSNNSSFQHNPLPTPVIICLWILLSTGVIFYNRHIMVQLPFPYPITLTTMHLIFQTFATRILNRYTSLIGVKGPSVSVWDSFIKIARRQNPYASVAQEEQELGMLPRESGPSDETHGEASHANSPMDSVLAPDIDNRTYYRIIVPSAAMFSASLVLSNWAYLYLSTAFIHMLKALAPVFFLLLAFAFQLKVFSWRLLGIVGIISLGVGISSYGETSFSFIGFCIQMAATIIEATRVTLIQVLLMGNNMSPLKSLYYFAPVCLFINMCLILPVEGFAPFRQLPNPLVIVSNAALTFLLNMASIYLINLSSMTLSLTKVVKDILLVGVSSLVLGDILTPLQLGGYAIATVGLIIYKIAS